MGLSRRKYDLGIGEAATDDECAPARLRDTIVRSAKLTPCEIEAEILRRLEYLVMLGRAKQLWDVFHHEYLSLGTLNDLKEWSPQPLADVSIPILVEKTKSLARGPPDYHIGFRDGGVGIVEQIDDIAKPAAVIEVPIVCVHGKRIEVIGPYRLETMTKVLGEAESQAACPGEQVNQVEGYPVLENLILEA